jgi:hypothetical protein
MFFVGYGGYSHSAQRRAGGFGLTLDDWEVMGNTPLPHENNGGNG